MTPPGLWAFTDHVCAGCFGRIVMQRSDEGARTFRCSNCGVEAPAVDGQRRPPMCCCGLSIGKKNAGIRCVTNPHPTPEIPSEIIARETS